jgi:fructose-1,6-bisphosphatase I
MAMLIEQAGGKAFAGTERLLDVRPTRVHQRTSVVLGSPDEVDRVTSFL